MTTKPVKTTVKKEPRLKRPTDPSIPGVDRPGNDRYSEDMPEALVDFFDVDTSEYLRHNMTTANKSNYQIIPDGVPSLVKFARHIGVTRSTLYVWAEKHPEFREAMAHAKDLHEQIIINITTATNGGFGQFMLKAKFGWRDNDDLNVGAAQVGGDVVVTFTRGKTKEEREAELAPGRDE